MGPVVVFHGEVGSNDLFLVISSLSSETIACLISVRGLSAELSSKCALTSVSTESGQVFF